MNEFLYFNDLFLCYQSLLTAKEQQVFRDYYSEDLSMQEIAENNMVSKSAIHKTIKIVKEKLKDYESKMHLNEINNQLQKILELDDANQIKNVVKKILENT